MTDEPNSNPQPPTVEHLRQRVFLMLGAIGAVAWIALLVLKELGLFPITYEGLAILGVVVGGLLQIEFIPSVFGGMVNR